MPKKVSVYSIYRGDQFVDVGTLRELSERQHISINTLMYEATPAYVERSQYATSLRVYRLNDTDK